MAEVPSSDGGDFGSDEMSSAQIRRLFRISFTLITIGPRSAVLAYVAHITVGQNWVVV